MARIKSPLLMADGARVRTMEELREHFDIVSVLAYYDSGKLHEWLESYYYDEEAEEISVLDPSSADIKEKICGILGVSCPEEEAVNIDLADVADKNKRLEKLKKYTGDDELLKAVDYVAFTQEELQGLLDGGAKKVYLCQEQGEFEIPEAGGVIYIGVNHPSASVPEWFGEKGIVLRNVDIGIEELLLSAEKNYSDKDYDEAVKLWSRAAAFGNAVAKRRLGRSYYNGEGVAQDYEEAFKWYMKAAEQGDAIAQRRVGDCYYYGKGVAEDDGEAFKWYMKAAEQGDANAQCRVGDCYYCGKGVAEDDGEAFKWYMKAAEQGDANAQCMVGECHYYGTGVAEDDGEAFKWYRKAAEQGNAIAQRMVGECHYYGRGVAEDKGEAFKWYRKAAEQGNAIAQRMVGECYSNEYGVAEDAGEAYEWYRKAAEQGDAIAQRMVGFLLDWYSLAGEDIESSYKWYRKAAEQGDAMAQYMVACYLKDSKESFKWCMKAAEQGEENAQLLLGQCYELGIGVEEDLELALDWYSKAMLQGNESASDAWSNLLEKLYNKMHGQ